MASSTNPEDYHNQYNHVDTSIGSEITPNKDTQLDQNNEDIDKSDQQDNIGPKHKKSNTKMLNNKIKKMSAKRKRQLLRNLEQDLRESEMSNPHFNSVSTNQLYDHNISSHDVTNEPDRLDPSHRNHKNLDPQFVNNGETIKSELPRSKFMSDLRSNLKSNPVPIPDHIPSTQLEQNLNNDRSESGFSSIENRRNNKQSPLDKLIADLKTKILNKHPDIEKIKHPELLLQSLTELNNSIGMDRLKESVNLQVMRLIEAINSDETELGMLNTILYGDPGVGKTRVGIILAKIWYSLGFLQSNVKHVNKWSNRLSEIPEEQMQMIIITSIIVLSYMWTAVKSIYQNLGWKWLLAITLVVIVILAIIWKYYSDRIDNMIKGSTLIDDSSEQNEQDNNTNSNTNSIPNYDKNKNDDFDRSIISVVSRRDFIGDYLGQTAGKTKKLLQDNLGKVLFIDEAYSLLNDLRDPYGMEALTTLNLFLSENPNKIVVIFAGYKDLMQRGIFLVQPGLPRRCMWHFECDPYDGNQLSEIFLLQLKKKGWNVTNVNDVRELISKNSKLFPSYGGDTERLIFYSQSAASKNKYYEQNKRGKNILTTDDIMEGLQLLAENNIHQDQVKNSSSGLNGLPPNALELLQRMEGL